MRAAMILMLLLPTLAFAGWRQLGSVTGTPADVVVVDAGLVVTSAVGANASAVAWQALNDGGVVQLMSIAAPNGFVGAGMSGACLSALTSVSPSEIQFSAGCGSTVTLNGSLPGGAYRSLGDRGVATLVSGSTVQLITTEDLTTGWALQGTGIIQPASARSLGAVTIDGVDYAALSASGVNGLRVSVDGGAPVSVAGAPACIDVVPFALAGSPALLAVTSAGAVSLFRDYRSPVLETPVIPAGLTARRVAFAGEVGLVSTATGVVLSPLPDPMHVGSTWVVRTGAPLLDGRVSCLDAKWCAGVTSAGAVWLYENAHAPTVGVTSVPSGQSIHFSADAGDDDGDPVFITWSAPGATITSDGGALNGGEVDVTFPGNSCTATLEVTARDGLFSTTQQVALSSTSRGALEISGPSMVLAGGAQVPFAASVDGGCVSATIAWSTSAGGVGSGALFSLTPPANECSLNASLTVTATATWSAGVPATSQTTQVVSVVPWGAPEAPVFAQNAIQDGGTSVIWTPENAAHVCASAAGFPGTTLLWEVDAGAVSATPVDGGLRIDATAQCERGQVVAFARRVVVGEQFNRVSDAGVLVVDVRSSVEPLNAATPFSLVASASAGVASGSTEFTAACMSQRVTSAHVTINEDSAAIASGTFTSPGAWSLAIPGGCAGGAYEVVAQLFEDGGFTGAEARELVTTTATPVAIGALDVERVVAVCDAQEPTNATLLPVDGSCLGADVSWRVISGPEVEMNVGTGAVVPLQLAARDFSSVGQTLVLEFTANGGGANVVTETRSLTVGVNPFIDIGLRSEPVLQREEDGRVIVASLRNDQACGVDGLVVEFSMTSVAADSVTIDGVPTPIEKTETGFRVSGVSVPATSTTELRFHAGAVLLGGRVSPPLVTLNGEVVSYEFVERTPVRRCGCSGLSGIVLPVWVGVLALLRRRRYRR